MTAESGRAGELVSYDRLYRQWEQNPWSATDIDLAADDKDWKDSVDGPSTRFDPVELRYVPRW